CARHGYDVPTDAMDYW
nr:immunoglobulin heavy chain junction region [Mus musculus]